MEIKAFLIPVTLKKIKYLEIYLIKARLVPERH
jgi:hypothetical protein